MGNCSYLFCNICIIIYLFPLYCYFIKSIVVKIIARSLIRKHYSSLDKDNNDFGHDRLKTIKIVQGRIKNKGRFYFLRFKLKGVERRISKWIRGYE